jgi:hypothetical protein
MPSQKLTELTLTNSASTDDVLYIVTDYQPGDPILSGYSRQIYYSALTQSMGFVSVTNNVDNSIVTATDTPKVVNGENNLKFSGTSLSLTGATNVTGKGTYTTLRVGSGSTTVSATSVSTIVSARKGTPQSLTSGVSAIISGWTNLYTSNASEWNPTTGVFTATKNGIYRVSSVITFDTHTSPAVNTEYNGIIARNGTNNQVGAFYVPVSGVTAPVQVWAHSFIVLSVGDTITFIARQNTGSNLNMGTSENLNMITIEEVRTIITV